MGISNEEDLRLADSDAHETLPLYEEARAAIAAPIDLPPREATPEEVREFFAQVLQARGSIAREDARQIAARWTRGTGQELRSYPLSMYREIFGPEDVWAIYKEVRTFHYKAEEEIRLASRRPACIVTAVWICVFLVSLSIAFSGLNDGWRITGGIVAFISFPLIPICASPLFSVASPESRAETELKAVDWNKAPVIPSSAS